MSKPKKKREKAKRRLKRDQHPRERSTLVDARFIKPDIHREIRNITQLAQAEDSRIVTIGNLVLFSTRTRDAWMLDPEDDFALCVCREGEPQPYRLVETPETFAIDWPSRFAIQGETFIVHERSGQLVTIRGYPTEEISAACQS